jgi:molybdopterin synthase catalytic subunit
MEVKKKKYFIDGAVTPEMIAASIAKHSSKKNIGAHSIFLGQVRDDLIDEKPVCAIDYSAYEEMAEDEISVLREEIISKYELTCLHVYHSMGLVNAGEISLFVFASSPHRKAAMDACREMVEGIKKDVPVWGKEIFHDNSHHWKENKYRNKIS